jgi:hypothetical protein
VFSHTYRREFGTLGCCGTGEGGGGLALIVVSMREHLCRIVSWLSVWQSESFWTQTEHVQRFGFHFCFYNTIRSNAWYLSPYSVYSTCLTCAESWFDFQKEYSQASRTVLGSTQYLVQFVQDNIPRGLSPFVARSWKLIACSPDVQMIGATTPHAVMACRHSANFIEFIPVSCFNQVHMEIVTPTVLHYFCLNPFSQNDRIIRQKLHKCRKL